MEAISLKNVYFKYGKDSQQAQDFAVENISLSIDEGEFVAFLGHNGSGKSTVAKLLNGLLTPEQGDVLVYGVNTREPATIFDVRKNVGMVFQNPDNQMIATIVEDDIAFGPENIGVEPAEIARRVSWALKSVGMEKFMASSSHRLSGGQKQRIAIAGVLAIKPKILVLDESTAMLDPVGRREVMSVIKNLNKELGMTVILITHFMEEAAEADRVFVFNDGHIALSGKPAEIFYDHEYLSKIGLSVPISAEIARRLRDMGIDIEGDILKTEELFSAICRLL